MVTSALFLFYTVHNSTEISRGYQWCKVQLKLTKALKSFFQNNHESEPRKNTKFQSIIIKWSLGTTLHLINLDIYIFLSTTPDILCCIKMAYLPTIDERWVCFCFTNNYLRKQSYYDCFYSSSRLQQQLFTLLKSFLRAEHFLILI